MATNDRNRSASALDAWAKMVMQQMAVQQMVARGQRSAGSRAARSATYGYGYGVPGPFSEAVRKLAKGISAESEHDVYISTRYDTMMDCYIFTAGCTKCRHNWEHAITAKRIREATPDEVVRELIPWGAEIMETTCETLEKSQRLAEYITNRLRAAGRDGLPYAQLCHEIIVDELAPGGDVDRILRKMKMDFDWSVEPTSEGWLLPVLRLPEGHPLRSW